MTSVTTTPGAEIDLAMHQGSSTLIDVERVVNSPRFPTLPAVALRLVDLLGNTDVDINEVGNLIKTDPALTLLILRTANSPVYSLRREITSIDHALVILGHNTVMTLALGFTLVDAARSNECGTALEQYWLRSIIHAAAAELLGGRYETRQCSELFLCGLLCDIGRLALLKVAPDRYTAVLHEEETLATAADTAAYRPLVELEHQLLGIDHVTLGSRILEKWGLPEIVRMAARTHHTPLEELELPRMGREARIIRSVAVSATVADYFMYPTSAAIAQRAWQAGNAHFEFTEDDWKIYLSEVHRRTQQIGEMLNIQTSSMTDPVEIIALANSHLVALTVKSQAIAAEAWTHCHTLKKTQSDLEHENMTLKRRIVRDGLTQVYNRSFFEEYVEKELDRARRSNGAVAMIFCDIDKFKSLNDTYGHPFGDHVLKSVSQAIQATVRSSDVVARYGGEEFVILVVNSQPRALHEIAERVRAAVESLAIHEEGMQIRVTISVGLTHVSHVGTEPSCETLVARADAAMYEAKRRGGNNVCVHDGESIHPMSLAAI